MVLQYLEVVLTNKKDLEKSLKIIKHAVQYTKLPLAKITLRKKMKHYIR